MCREYGDLSVGKHTLTGTAKGGFGDINVRIVELWGQRAISDGPCNVREAAASLLRRIQKNSSGDLDLPTLLSVGHCPGCSRGVSFSVSVEKLPSVAETDISK